MLKEIQKGHCLTGTGPNKCLKSALSTQNITEQKNWTWQFQQNVQKEKLQCLKDEAFYFLGIWGLKGFDLHNFYFFDILKVLTLLIFKRFGKCLCMWIRNSFLRNNPRTDISTIGRMWLSGSLEPFH